MANPSNANILEVRHVSKAFGGVQAVVDVTFDVPRGSITGLIGPNGAGKSTLVSCLSGFYRADSGSVMLNQEEISHWPSYKIAQRGLIRTFQIARELRRLTVFENLLLAPQNQSGVTSFQALFRRRKIAQSEQMNIQRAADLMRQFHLFQLRDEYAGNLSGGQKKLLELARALMARPSLVLLDEPMAGVNPTLAVTLQEHIRSLMQQGITFLLIEHNLAVVESLCDHVVVVAEGNVLAKGKMSELRANKSVVTAYLGG